MPSRPLKIEYNKIFMGGGKRVHSCYYSRYICSLMAYPTLSHADPGCHIPIVERPFHDKMFPRETSSVLIRNLPLLVTFALLYEIKNPSKRLMCGNICDCYCTTQYLPHYKSQTCHYQA